MSDLTPIKLPTRSLLARAAENEFNQILFEYNKVNGTLLVIHNKLKDLEEAAGDLELDVLFTAVKKARAHFHLLLNDSFPDIQDAIEEMK